KVRQENIYNWMEQPKIVTCKNIATVIAWLIIDLYNRPKEYLKKTMIANLHPVVLWKMSRQTAFLLEWE
ncbi:unnamed protein product, partial [Dovyalis caffra]